MHQVTLVDIDSEINAGDTDQETDMWDAKRFDGDSEDHQLQL